VFAFPSIVGCFHGKLSASVVLYLTPLVDQGLRPDEVQTIDTLALTSAHDTGLETLRKGKGVWGRNKLETVKRTGKLRTSQYFLRHSDRLHLHPMLCALWGVVPVGRGPARAIIRGLNAFGFFARVSFIALFRMSSCSVLFRQSLQLHPSQTNSAAKHSQYSLRHFDFLQLHGLRRSLEDIVDFSDGVFATFEGLFSLLGVRKLGVGCAGYREADADMVTGCRLWYGDGWRDCVDEMRLRGGSPTLMGVLISPRYGAPLLCP
jgi:hypothetical protein